MIVKILIKTFVSAILVVLSSVVIAGPILWVGDSSGNLGKVDVATGNVTVVGNMGFAMTDIAFDTNGNLYGTTFSDLYSIDSSSGTSTHIGIHSLGVNSLVFDAAGTLYAASSQLFTINVGTAATTLIGNGSDSYSSSGDLAFVGGELYLSSSNSGNDKLVKLDTGTGAGTNVGDIGYPNVYGLATNNNIDLYGLSGFNILNVNVGTGAGAIVSNYSGKGLGIAWGSSFYAEAGASSVPEPSTLAIFALSIIGFASQKLKKQ
jgi:hypothetical protein